MSLDLLGRLVLPVLSKIVLSTVGVGEDECERDPASEQ
jgi:hypothetical protein